VLSKIFEHKKDEVREEWRKLHNEELSDLYCSSSNVRVVKSRRMRWVRYVAHTGKRRGVYRVLVGKPDGRKTFGRPRRRWVDNIKMDLRKLNREAWICMYQYRDRWRALVNAAMNLRVP